jgi:histone demethylase JARID1
MFRPRVQRINELEALTRAKLCFFEKIIKYWNFQGTFSFLYISFLHLSQTLSCNRDINFYLSSILCTGISLKIPVIDRKIVDLYKLHRTVFDEGGFESCVREKKWMKIASKLYRKSNELLYEKVLLIY